MAKGEKGDKESGDESYEFLPPDFDEDAFIHKEIVSFRTTAILFVWGILAALVSWGAFAAVDGRDSIGWPVGLAICLVFGLALKFIFPRLKADISHWGRREWLGTAFLFFFTWLAFFIVIINPPISDYAAPTVSVHANPAVQQAGGLVTVDAFAEDNIDVASHDLELLSGGSTRALPAAQDLGRGHTRYNLTDLPVGTYVLRGSAVDVNGHIGTGSKEFTLVEKTLELFLPDGGRIDSPTDQVFVQAQGAEQCKTKKGTVTQTGCIRTVRLELVGGGSIAMEHVASDGGWRATSNFAGWHPDNNTFRVVAEFADEFQGTTVIDGGAWTLPSTSTVKLTIATGEFEVKVPNDRTPNARNVPAPVAALAFVALLGAAAMRRRE